MVFGKRRSIKVLQNRSFALSRLFTNVSVYAGERKSERSEREAHGVLPDKIENISASNTAMKLKLGEHVVA